MKNINITINTAINNATVYDCDKIWAEAKYDYAYEKHEATEEAISNAVEVFANDIARQQNGINNFDVAKLMKSKIYLKNETTKEFLYRATLYIVDDTLYLKQEGRYFDKRDFSFDASELEDIINSINNNINTTLVRLEEEHMANVEEAANKYPIWQKFATDDEQLEELIEHRFMVSMDEVREFMNKKAADEQSNDIVAESNIEASIDTNDVEEDYSEDDKEVIAKITKDTKKIQRLCESMMLEDIIDIYASWADENYYDFSYTAEEQITKIYNDFRAAEEAKAKAEHEAELAKEAYEQTIREQYGLPEFNYSLFEDEGEFGYYFNNVEEYEIREERLSKYTKDENGLYQKVFVVDMYCNDIEVERELAKAKYAKVKDLIKLYQADPIWLAVKREEYNKQHKEESLNEQLDSMTMTDKIELLESLVDDTDALNEMTERILKRYKSYKEVLDDGLMLVNLKHYDMVEAFDLQAYYYFQAKQRQ